VALKLNSRITFNRFPVPKIPKNMKISQFHFQIVIKLYAKRKVDKGNVDEIKKLVEDDPRHRQDTKQARKS
jgi:hypothetical protein